MTPDTQTNMPSDTDHMTPDTHTDMTSNAHTYDAQIWHRIQRHLKH